MVAPCSAGGPRRGIGYYWGNASSGYPSVIGHCCEPLGGFDATMDCGNKSDAPRVLYVGGRQLGQREFGVRIAPWMTGGIDSRRWCCHIWMPHTGLRSGYHVRPVTQRTSCRRRSCAPCVDLTPALKRQQRRAFVPLPEEQDVHDGHAMIATDLDPESTSLRRDEERTLDRLMSTLPEEPREVLVLREIEELDYRQIATITNVPIGTVMSRLARARAALKARLLQEAKGHPHAVC